MIEPELSKSYDPTEVEARWYRLWMERGYFTASATSDKPAFCMVLPPPNVTGSLHLGHALTATLQDTLIRWKRMSGFNCLWVPGTDHAGISTQMMVERDLKKTEKKTRHDLGRAEFLKRVWAWKEKYGARIGEQHKVLGASLDWTRERFTMDERSSAAVREAFVQLHQQGLIYRANRLINWCPSCLTALSDLEVEHEDREGSLWHIRYPVKGSDRMLTVATTRPETMLGDTALAIHPDDPRYQGLAGQTAIVPLVQREIPIVADAELVSMEFGTGVVKVTPAHDFNDYQTGLRHKLPMISIFDENARTNKEAGPYAGLDRYDARTRVLEDLIQRGLMEKQEPHSLSVAVCDRCRTVVEPRLSLQWYVKIEPLAKPAIEAVEQGRTRFVPESWTATYFQWMRNIHDWCISRQLWWGHQIPAYYCLTCSPRVGDDTDLPLDAPTTRVGGIDFDRATPVVAREQPAACEKCGGSRFQQDPDVLDTWFSSALWPFSTLGWPAQTAELKTFYPTSVMETGHDIIFFWVSRMMMMGLNFMKDVPFRTVYLHAMVRDEKGDKMSKTKGNVIDPLDLIQGASASALPPSLKNKFPQGMPAFGADALRFTLASLTQQGRDIKLSPDRVGGYKAFGNKLWNAARFALMNMGGFREGATWIKDRRLTLADRWILSRLNQAVSETQRALEAFEFSDAASTLYQFVWYEFCDWYIELAKGALYGEQPIPKETARAVLVFALDRILRLLHPLMPFITEEIWQKLPLQREAESIMLASFPRADPRLRDDAAEAEMQPIIAAIEGLRNIRGESNLAPGAKLNAVIQSGDAAVRQTLETWRSYLMPLAGLGSVEIGSPGKKPSQAAVFVGKAMEIFVPLAGLIDLDEERARLEKEIGRVDGELASLLRKLENPNFVARAPREVVEESKARIAELHARKTKLQDNLNRLAPEDSMPDENKPPEAPMQAPPVASIVTNAETARVKIVEPEPGGAVDLGAELKGELAEASIPAGPDSHVKDALDKLREGTKEGLTSSDHYDLGVAYMGMGLVDDAVREFNEAKKPARRKTAKKTPKKKAKAVKTPAKKMVSKAKAKLKPAVKDLKKAGRTVKAVAKKAGARVKARAKAAIKKVKARASKPKRR